ncbi:MAG: lipopolysaccharide heptosyltransferase family protein [Desulfobacteraceae bacterium]|nr:MAG: lipopolysaccharide heptosyltransferase family protein [Desulfobacteraceae bacterium]
MRDILIIRPAALGDTLMLLPALQRIGQTGSIALVGRRPGIEYVKSFAPVCLDFEGPGWHTLFTDTPAISNLPGAEMVSVFLGDPDGKVKRNLETLLPGAKVHVFPGLPLETEGVHAAFHLARCLRKAGCEGVNPEECVEEALNRPLLRLPGTKRERIIFHPGSGSRLKNHSPEFWLELIRNMTDSPLFRGFQSTLILGPAEEGLRDFFESRLHPEWNGVILSSPVPENLMALMKEGALYVGQDSGVTHLAAVMGLPTIALFKNSSTIPMWRPLGPLVRVLVKEAEMGFGTVMKEAESLL